METMKSKHATYQIGYHIIFCTKYRNNILRGIVEVETKKIIGETCITYGWKLPSIEVMPDHVHLFVQTDHKITPYRISQIIKSISAVYLFSKFPSLKKTKFWGNGLWSRSAYYATVGNISEKTVRTYINNQKKKGDVHLSLEISSKIS